MGLRWEGYQPAFFVLGILFPILATIAVVVRFHANRMRFGKWTVHWDDVFVVLGLIFNYAWSVNIIIDSQLGNLGGHMAFTPDGLPIPSPDTVIFLQTNYASTILVIPCLGFTKIGIILYYQRIFESHKFRKWTWLLLGIVIAYSVVFLFVNLFQCWPLYAQWTPGAGGGCVNLYDMFLTAVVFNTVTDILILAWPIREVTKLQMPLRRKILVMGIFLLGGFVTIVGIIRIAYLAQAESPLEKPFFNDITYNFSPAILWTVIEINVATICACLPLLRPIYQGYNLNHAVDSVRSLLRASKSRSVTGSRYTSSHSSQDVKKYSSDESNENLRPTVERDPYEMETFGGGSTNGRSYRIDGTRSDTTDAGIVVKHEFERRSDSIV